MKSMAISITMMEIVPSPTTRSQHHDMGQRAEVSPRWTSASFRSEMHEFSCRAIYSDVSSVLNAVG
jgi:hypothetical protein